MFKLIAYLIAIFSLYRKQLLILFLLLLAVLILVPSVKKADPRHIDSGSVERSGVKVSKSAARIGQKYHSLAELKTAEAVAGFVTTGFFGDSWPATVTEVTTAADSISFSRQGGTKHTYKGFGGYRMKVVKLLSEKQQEVIVVFRSRAKG